MALRSRGSIPQELAAAKRRAIARFLPAPGTSTRRVVHRVGAHPQRNVVGVGVGAKIVKGKTTDRPSGTPLCRAQALEGPAISRAHAAS